MSRACCLLALAGGLAFPGVAFAQADTAATVEVSTSAGGSSNPFTGPGGASGFVEARVRPKLDIRTARSTVSISGDAEVQQYFKTYSTRDNYSARADYTGRWSERLNATASVNYLNSISGSVFSGLSVPTDPTNPTVPIVGTDIGLYGTGNRLQSITGQVGLSMQFTSRDSVNVFGNGATTRNSQGGPAIDYDSYGGGMSYQRQINAAIKLGVTGSVSATDYRGGGNNLVYTGQGTFEARLSDYWNLNGGIGVSRLSVSGPSSLVGSSKPSTTLSGNVTLCRTLTSGPICVTASRAILPSSFGGARVQSSVSASYSTRLSERSTINANAAFTEVGSGGNGNTTSALPQVSGYRYFSAGLNYDRRIRQRLRGTVSTFYRKVDGGSLNQNDDYGGEVGLTYTFGKLH